MSYQEKNITVSMVSHVLILVYYVTQLYQMLQTGELVSAQLFGLSAVAIIALAIINIIASILTNILLSIVQAIKTRSDKVDRFIEDERDKLIGLKGTRTSYITHSIGVLVGLLSFVFGQPPLVMFGLIIFFGLVAQIAGDITQIYLYRRGF